MKRWGLLIAALIALAGTAMADTSTTHAGLVKPDIGSTGWGSKMNSNFDIVDSSFACLGTVNTFSQLQTLGNGISLTNGGGLALYSTFDAIHGSTIQNNSVGKYSAQINAKDGLSVNGTYVQGIGLSVSGNDGFSGGSPYGTFAVVGSSQDASVAYSGFIGTSPISQSTLWSLPKKDGSSGQLLQTDGSTHLSFTNTISSASFSNITANGLQIPFIFPNNVIFSSLTRGTTGSNDVAIHQDNALLELTDTTNPFATGNGYGLKIAAQGHLGAPSTYYGVHVSEPGVGFGATAYGFYSLIDQAASSDNYGAFLSASGASKQNYGLWVDRGQVIVQSSMTVNQGISVSTLTVATSMTASTATITHLVGTTTNDSATLGTVGESSETVNSAGVNAAASGSQKEIGHIQLTAGDWDLSGLVLFEGQGGATSFTASGNFEASIGGTTASTAGTTMGLDYVKFTEPTTTTAAYLTLYIPRKIVKISSPTTYYLNAACVYTSTAPKIYGYLNARRVR